MRFRCRYLLFCLFLIVCGVAVAQPIAPAPGSASTTSGNVQEAKPDLFYLRDKDGKLEPVLGFTLDDFERLLTQGNRRDLTPVRPTYRIDKLVARGDAIDDRANLTLDFSITVDDEHWVRVPLRMTEGVIQGKPTYHGPGRFFVEYDAARSEYVAWLSGKSDEPHQLTVPLLVPLTTATTETRLKLSVPRALSSELNLFVPIKHAVAQLPPGSILDSTKAEGKGTRFRVLGLTTDFTLSWRQGEMRAVEAPTVLESSGALLVRIDGRSVHTQAHLNVRSFGGAFDTFQVRLPPGAVLLTTEQPEYSVKTATIEKPLKGGDPAALTPMATVRLRSPTVGPVSIRFATTQPFEISDLAEKKSPGKASPAKRAKAAAKDEPALQGDRVELGGFEVVGAVRQWGHLAVQVVGDWQVTWGQRRQVRQVEDVPAELWRDDMLAAFEYFAQPFSLEARVLPRETRMSFDAQYLAMVSDSAINLDAHLKYRISGAKAFELKIDLEHWEIDDIGPPSIVAIDNLSPTDAGILTVPLAKPVTGNIEISLRAHRRHADDATSVEFALPKPVATPLGPTTLVVLPDDNVEITPQLDALSGLTVQHSMPDIVMPVRQQSPLVYQSEKLDAHFAAHLRVFRRSIAAAAHNVLVVADESVHVEQRLLYTIKHEAAEVLSLYIASDILDRGNVVLRVGDRLLEWDIVGDDAQRATKLPLVHVKLPEPAIGPVELTAEFDMPIEPLMPRSTTALVIPLVMPTDSLVSNDLSISTPQEMRLQLLDPAWQASDVGTKDHRPLEATATSARGEVSFSVKLRQLHPIIESMVDRVWIQTWLGERSRQDRAAYRLTTTDRNVAIKLPTGVAAVELLVDGTRVAPDEGSSLEQVVVPLAHGEEGALAHTIELRYRFSDRRSRPVQGTMALEAPTLPKKLAPRRTFWQVVLPADEHLWMPPENFTAEYTWSWSGMRWGRTPVLGQSELESWIGTRHDTPLPPTVHSYLFSTSDPDTTLQLSVVRRSVLVLEASGLALIVGLVLVYWSAVRQPSIFLIVAIGAAALAIVYPQPAIVLAEASALGLCLTVLAAALRRGFHDTRVATSRPLRSGPSSILERGSTRTQPHYRDPIAGSMSTTSAPELSMPVPETEAQR